jgi:hypothetical protein
MARLAFIGFGCRPSWDASAALNQLARFMPSKPLPGTAPGAAVGWRYSAFAVAIRGAAWDTIRFRHYHALIQGH